MMHFLSKWITLHFSPKEGVRGVQIQNFIFGHLNVHYMPVTQYCILNDFQHYCVDRFGNNILIIFVILKWCDLNHRGQVLGMVIMVPKCRPKIITLLVRVSLCEFINFYIRANARILFIKAHVYLKLHVIHIHVDEGSR